MASAQITRLEIESNSNGCDRRTFLKRNPVHKGTFGTKNTTDYVTQPLNQTSITISWTGRRGSSLVSVFIYFYLVDSDKKTTELLDSTLS